MKELTTVKISISKKKILLRIAKKYQMTQIDLIESMVNFFDKTGANPKDDKVLSPSEEIKRLRDTVIGFFRTQEREYIKPVFSKIDLIMEDYFKTSDKVLKEISILNKEDNKLVPKLKLDSDLIQESNEKSNEKSILESQEILNLKTENSKLKSYLNTLISDLSSKKFLSQKYTILTTSEIKLNEVKQFLGETVCTQK